MHVLARLMRLHQPTGIWLLLWPSWWAVALASQGKPSLFLLALFASGALVMRGAGCIVNDMVDRDFDRQVERTRNRPLASGDATMLQAILVLCFLLLIAFIIALQMNRMVLYLAAVSLLLVITYPFMKRVTWWPQAFLGLTFNWGALLGWAAVTGNISASAFLLYTGGIFWTLGYDTVYAHQDKVDDVKIGVKSTALRLGEHSKNWIAGFYSLTMISWLMAGALNHNGLCYYAALLGVSAHFACQVRKVDLDDNASCLRIFKSNAMLGWILFAGIIADGF